MQLIDSSERADTLLSNIPEWDSNQLPPGCEPEVRTIILLLHKSNAQKSNAILSNLDLLDFVISRTDYIMPYFSSISTSYYRKIRCY